jgi:enoyl-CoA hydratase/carnithine racemase
VTFETLLTSRSEGVARIVLNRPDVRNALSRTVIDELASALAAFEADADARVIVLSGAGEQAFCAGADLKSVGDRGTTLQARASFPGLAKILESIPQMRTPVIAQVRGFALAGAAGSRWAATSSSRRTTRRSAYPRLPSASCRSS